MYIRNNKSDLDQQQKCFWYVLGPQENKPLPRGRGGGGGLGKCNPRERYEKGEIKKKRKNENRQRANGGIKVKMVHD
jgi:hypothetical protein